MNDRVEEVLNRLRAFLRKRPLERELNEEIREHLDLAIEENLRRGLSPDEARRKALVSFGGVEQAREVHREAPIAGARHPDAGSPLCLSNAEAGSRLYGSRGADSCAGHWGERCGFQRGEWAFCCGRYRFTLHSS